MKRPEFKFYVKNFDYNTNKLTDFNIFDNRWVNDGAYKAVKEYLKKQEQYTYEDGEKTYKGFDAFVKKLRRIIMSELWSRAEYEIIVTGMFTDKETKISCYDQVLPNMEMLARELIYQATKKKK